MEDSTWEVGIRRLELDKLMAPDKGGESNLWFLAGYLKGITDSNVPSLKIGNGSRSHGGSQEVSQSRKEYRSTEDNT